MPLTYEDRAKIYWFLRTTGEDVLVPSADAIVEGSFWNRCVFPPGAGGPALAKLRGARFAAEMLDEADFVWATSTGSPLPYKEIYRALIDDDAPGFQEKLADVLRRSQTDPATASTPECTAIYALLRDWARSQDEATFARSLFAHGTADPGGGGAAIRRPTADDLGQLRETFERHHAVVVPAFVAGDVLAELTTLIKASPFQSNNHGSAFVSEMTMVPNIIWGILKGIMGSLPSKEVLSQVTGNPVASFRYLVGRVFMMRSQADHFIDWHNDLITADDHAKLFGVTLSLTFAPYEGGKLQVRDAGSPDLQAEFGPIVAGDLAVFRISPALEHRVTPLTAGIRLVFTGWWMGDQEAPGFYEYSAD